MERLNYFLSFLLLFVFGANVSAQNVKLGEQLSEIPTDGTTQVFLQTATDQNSYWDGDIQNPTGDVTDNCVALLVPTGKTVDNTPTYYIKQVSTGKYVLDHPREDASEVITFSVGTTDDISNALAVTILPADADGDYRTKASTAKQTIDGAFVICAADVYKSGGSVYCTYLGWYSGQPMMSSYHDTNSWYVYSVEQCSPVEKLDKALAIYFPNGVDESSYPTGAQPGYYDATIVANALAVYNKAQDALNSESTLTEEQANAMVEELKSASDALADGKVAITTGYYLFMGAGRSQKAGTFAMYDDGSALKWNTTAYEIPSTFTVDDAKYIFHITASNDTVFIKNVYTGLYPQSVATSTSVSTAADSIPYVYAPTSTKMVASFCFNPADDTNTYHKLHEAAGGSIVGWVDSDASSFQLVPVDAAQIESLLAEIQQMKLNTTLSELVENVDLALHNAVAYKATVDNVDADGNLLFDDLGLVSTADQLYCNYPEPSEGQGVAGLVDNNATTYLHTMWSSTSNVTDYHYVEADLGEAVQTFVLQLLKRQGAANDHLSRVRILATNDTTGTWTDQGVYGVSYNKKGIVAGNEYANSASLTGIKMDQAYRFVRVKGIATNRKPATYPWWHAAEMRFYNAEVDADNSTLPNVDAALVSALNEQLAAANAAIEAGKATQAGIDALQAAYDAVNAQIPDPSRVATAISNLTSAKDAYYYSEDGEVGSFPTAQKEAAEAALAEVQAQYDSKTTAQWTLAEINDAVAKLEAVGKTLSSSMTLPEAGKLYVIRAATTSTSYGRAPEVPLYAPSSSLTSGISYMPPASTGGDSVDVATHYNYVWLVESVDADSQTVVLRNLYTGRYIGQQSETSASITQSAEPVSLPIVSARVSTSGAVGLKVYEDDDYTEYLNLGSNGNVVSWTTGESGADNSAFTFTEIDLSSGEGLTYVPVTPNVMQIITLPFAAGTFVGEGTAYTSVGVDANTEGIITLEELPMGESEIVTGGVPFIYEAAEETELPVYVVLGDNNLPKWGFNDSYVNGIVGTVDGTTISDAAIEAGAWIYDEGELKQITSESSAAEKKIAANGGYISVLNAVGVKSVDTATSSSAAQGKVYDLQGRRVVKAQKGLYIINGKKVLVK